MTAIHEPGDVWHIGWDHPVQLWYVEPPYDVELDEPIKWYANRDDAFEFVDKQIREQPVQASVVDEHLIDDLTEKLSTPTDIPPALARALSKQRNAPAPEVKEPVRQYANKEAAQRVADYQAMVGLQ